METLLLSRLQFALTIMFHYIFPPLSIGLGVVIAYLLIQHVRTGDRVYEAAAKFWTKLFALTFGIGVATGIVMEFQFGTNWAPYSRFVGDVFGSALAAEGIFAFFLESGFLAILVFGWGRVGPKFLCFAACMVALGSIFSSVWIVIANSWQQTPAGAELVPMIRDGAPWVLDGETVTRAEVTDFWAMVFNPSTVQRLVHVWIGCLIMGATFVSSIASYYLLRGRHTEFARRSLTGGVALGALASIAALISGHSQANNVYRTQPAKLAAFEAHYQTGPGNLALFGIPNDATQHLDHAVEAPGVLSFLLFGDLETHVIGLDAIRPEDRPAVPVPFVSYRLMVGLGTALLALFVLAAALRVRGTLEQHRWVLFGLVLSVLPALIANQAGWVAAETGRQPWIVHPRVDYADHDFARDADGFVAYTSPLRLRTADGVSEVVPPEHVLASILLFSSIYLLLGALWLFVLNRKIHVGPEDVLPKDGGAVAALLARPAHEGDA